MKFETIGYLSDGSVTYSDYKNSDGNVVKHPWYHARLKEYPSDKNYIQVNMPDDSIPSGKVKVLVDIAQKFVGESKKTCFTHFNVLEITSLT